MIENNTIEKFKSLLAGGYNFSKEDLAKLLGILEDRSTSNAKDIIDNHKDYIANVLGIESNEIWHTCLQVTHEHYLMGGCGEEYFTNFMNNVEC